MQTELPEIKGEPEDHNSQCNIDKVEVNNESEILSKSQKIRVISVLFGRLINMHKNIMTTFTVIHIIVISFALLHIFTIGTIEMEDFKCYMTWPLSHLYYSFINYLFCWFYCYNACEITNKKGYEVILVSKKFLKILLLISLTPIPLKFISAQFCRNWSLSWNSVIFQTIHILVECMIVFVYFFWFERRYSGFRIFYHEQII